eukprot:TRINITY_DN65761_c7_g1_i4.p1 TRINITY_DN65761_c7_g1~~TRINITY_DN65761_c7_g1_i4.p1  ORF type:complete len:200 (+),score=129.43 TRINITY_DN65761_c7_g1_i4:325-924(+)
MEKREKHLQGQIDAALAEARKRSKAKDKSGALYNLRRKKLLQSKLDQISGKKLNLETQIFALEDAASNKEYLGAMKQSNVTLQTHIKEADIDKAADIMDDITDQLTMIDEMGEALAQPIGQQMDEDELAAELEEMDAELLDEEMLEAPMAPKVKHNVGQEQFVDPMQDAPSVPSAPVKKQETQEEREAREMAELNDLLA